MQVITTLNVVLSLAPWRWWHLLFPPSSPSSTCGFFHVSHPFLLPDLKYIITVIGTKFSFSSGALYPCNSASSSHTTPPPKDWSGKILIAKVEADWYAKKLLSPVAFFAFVFLHKSGYNFYDAKLCPLTGTDIFPGRIKEIFMWKKYHWKPFNCWY